MILILENKDKDTDIFSDKNIKEKNNIKIEDNNK
jgi:hypothetical protein